MAASPSFWRDRPTLVTGATGLLGSWLARRLLAAQADVVCLVRDWVPHSELVRAGTLDSVNVVRGDVRDRDLLERALGEYEIDTVFHLAAQTIVGHRQPQSRLHVRKQHPGHLECSGGLPALARRSSRSWWPRPTRPTAIRRRLPYAEDTPLARPPSLRRQQILRRPDRADLRANLRAAGGHHPLRQFLWRRRSELEPHRARHHSLRAARRAAVIRSDGQFVRDYFYVEDGAAAYMLLAERLAADTELRGRGLQFLERNSGHGVRIWCNRFLRAWIRSPRARHSQRSVRTKSATSISARERARSGARTGPLCSRWTKASTAPSPGTGISCA